MDGVTSKPLNRKENGMNAELYYLIAEQALEMNSPTFRPYAAAYEPDAETLEQAGLEECDAPVFGFTAEPNHDYPHTDGGVMEYLTWFSDGEDSRYEVN